MKSGSFFIHIVQKLSQRDLIVPINIKVLKQSLNLLILTARQQLHKLTLLQKPVLIDIIKPKSLSQRFLQPHLLLAIHGHNKLIKINLATIILINLF